MRDEFNQPKEKLDMVEFSEELHLREFDQINEDISDGSEEFGTETKEFPVDITVEFTGGDSSDLDDQNKKYLEKKKQDKKRRSFLQKLRNMGYAVVATAAVATVTQTVYPDFTILPEPMAMDISADDGDWWEEETSKPRKDKDDDDSFFNFPTRGSDDSDGGNDETVPDFVLNEEDRYIRIRDVGSDDAKYIFFDFDGEEDDLVLTYSGVSYNPGINTLFLNNVDIDILEINDMGPELTIEYSGECNVGCILSYFHGTGCELHVAGEGKLYINRWKRYAVGFFVQANATYSRVNFDYGGEVLIEGNKTAIVVAETMYSGKGISCGASLTISGGSLEEMSEDDRINILGVYMDTQNYNYALFDQGVMATTVTIAAEEETVIEFDPASYDGLDILDHSVLSLPEIAEATRFPINNSTSSTDNDYIYVILKNFGGGYYLYADEASGSTVSEVEGFRYDVDTNTLYIENIDIEEMDIKLMGTGFTIVVEGLNVVEHILCDGYFYGGSITFDGTGTLILNRNRRYTSGLRVDAGLTNSFIAFMPDVTVDAYGAGGYAAISIGNSLDPYQGIYCLSPSQIRGGHQRLVAEDEVGVLSAQRYVVDYEYYDYALFNKYGYPSQHVMIYRD